MDASKQTISPLRQRMIEDMRMRKFGEKTQSQYLRAVKQFAKHLGRSPDTASVEELRRGIHKLLTGPIVPVYVRPLVTTAGLSGRGPELYFRKLPRAGGRAVSRALHLLILWPSAPKNRVWEGEGFGCK